MGYCEYWERSPEFNRDAFVKVGEDLRLLFPALRKMGVKLAGPQGVGNPEITDYVIAFNGAKDCGHRYMDLGDPWPAKNAEGVLATVDPIGDDEGARWFQGPYLLTRTCGGSCAGDPFIIDRKYLVRRWERPENGSMFSCLCETAYKPYDLAVTLALLRFKERMPQDIMLWSDSYEHGFEDAKRINREFFGWPKHFEMKPPEPALTVQET